MQDQNTPDYKPASNTIRTSVTVGPAKQRRRFTAVPEPLTIQMWMTTDQINTFKEFVQEDIQDALPFDWIDFRTGDNCSYRLPDGWGSVELKYDSGDIWQVIVAMEQLP
jgi:hypothetical protein